MVSDPDYARAVAGAALMSSVGGAAARPDSDTNASPRPEPYDPAPDSNPHYLTSDPDVERWYHVNRDLQAMADRREAVGRGQRHVGAMADARGYGVSEVLRARGESVRGEAGSERQGTMTPREAADALVREAQEHQPLSRVPDLIDEIRRERNDLRLQVQWMRERLDKVEARAKDLDLNLGSILAVIHGDGGQCYVRYGAEKATRDAIAKYYRRCPL